MYLQENINSNRRIILRVPMFFLKKNKISVKKALVLMYYLKYCQGSRAIVIVFFASVPKRCIKDNRDLWKDLKTYIFCVREVD